MLETLPNAELIRALCQLVTKDRNVEADVLAHLGEVDARRLYLAEGCDSMFRFCTDVLHFSEPTAYQRIRVARVSRTYPIVLERIRRGEIHVAGVTLLASHLTPEITQICSTGPSTRANARSRSSWPLEPQNPRSRHSCGDYPRGRLFSLRTPLANPSRSLRRDPRRTPHPNRLGRDDSRSSSP